MGNVYNMQYPVVERNSMSVRYLEGVSRVEAAGGNDSLMTTEHMDKLVGHGAVYLYRTASTHKQPPVQAQG